MQNWKKYVGPAPTYYAVVRPDLWQNIWAKYNNQNVKICFFELTKNWYISYSCPG